MQTQFTPYSSFEHTLDDVADTLGSTLNDLTKQVQDGTILQNRTVTLGLAALLILTNYRRQSLWSFAAGVIAGELFYRGVTGRSPILRALNMDASELPSVTITPPTVEIKAAPKKPRTRKPKVAVTTEES